MTHRNRRQFMQGGLAVAGLGLLAGCVQLPAQTKSPPKVPRIGYLRGTVTATVEIDAFRAGLRELGYVEGQNITIEDRLADSLEQIPTQAAELVDLAVDLIMTGGSIGDTQVAMDATRTIPIVNAASPDPVRLGFVASLARPGGNVTGLSTLAPRATGKGLELLRELVPGISRVMFLTRSVGSAVIGILQEAQQAAQLLGVQLLVPSIDTAADLDAAFQMAIADHAEALWVGSSPISAGR